MVSLLVLSGVLVTYRGGVELGRERYRDDGQALRSQVTLGPQELTVTVHRGAPTRVEVEVGGQSVDREVPPGAVVLENGAWQQYALAAAAHADARAARPVKFFLPASGRTLDGTIQVTPGEGGARHVEVHIGPLTATAEVSREGAVTSAAVPLQGLEVRPEGAPPPPRAERRPPPDGVLEEPLSVARPGVTLRGVVWRPATATARPPIVLIIAGSGPTDRDGNSVAGLNSDVYRQLAEGLTRGGVAVARFDKRGAGETLGTNDPARLVLADFAGDVQAIVAELRRGGRYGALTLAGHSEGGLLALLVAHETPVDGLALLATAGRPLGALLREQLSRLLSAAHMKDVDRLLGEVAAHRPVNVGEAAQAVARLPPPMRQLFHPSVVGYLRSELSVDPIPLLHSLRLPTVIVQGETDGQVSVDDARRLAAARSDARLVLLPRANHLFKEEASRALPQASYGDPSRPLVAGVVEAVLSVAKR